VPDEVKALKETADGFKTALFEQTQKILFGDLENEIFPFGQALLPLRRRDAAREGRGC
jgi:hypothetical protein